MDTECGCVVAFGDGGQSCSFGDNHTAALMCVCVCKRGQPTHREDDVVLHVMPLKPEH